MLFSELHKITLQGDEDWFDPILTKDTCLFIDPFSVFKSSDTLFEDKSQPYGLTTGSAGGLDEPLRGIFRYRL